MKNCFSDLRFNKIRHIPPECMSALGDLHTLLLNNNNVRKLRSGAFAGLGNLKYLYVKWNTFFRPADLWTVTNLAVHATSQMFPTRTSFGFCLRYLYKNHISHIESGTFDGLERLEHL